MSFAAWLTVLTGLTGLRFLGVDTVAVGMMVGSSVFGTVLVSGTVVVGKVIELCFFTP